MEVIAKPASFFARFSLARVRHLQLTRFRERALRTAGFLECRNEDHEIVLECGALRMDGVVECADERLVRGELTLDGV